MKTPKEKADQLIKKYGQEGALNFLSDILDEAIGTSYMYWLEVEKEVSNIKYCKDCGNKIHTEPETGLCRNCRNGIDLKHYYNDEDRFPLHKLSDNPFDQSQHL